MLNDFLNILIKSNKNNTYKFAFAKALIEYCNKTDIDGDIVIEIDYFASKFFEYYWYQEFKYKLIHNHNLKIQPTVISILQEYCGTSYIPQTFDKYFENKPELKKEIKTKIANSCFKDVIPRFQNNRFLYKHFYEILPSKNYKKSSKDHIVVSQEAGLFLKENSVLLTKTLVLEWAKFLEKVNFTPRLISKIENNGLPNRKSLQVYKEMLLKMHNKCFYCEKNLSDPDIHIDHFIPWSYIYSNDEFNLVASCSSCNLKKSDSLAERKYLEKLLLRNKDNDIDSRKIDIELLYDECLNSGFTLISDSFY